MVPSSVTIMFTGIIEEIGVVKRRTEDCLTLEADKVLRGMKVGDSIAVNGACLTVVSIVGHTFSVNIMPETFRCTNLGLLHYNDEVNLERALVLGDRVGGHLVLGHVDDIGKVMSVASEEKARVMRIEIPARLMPYIVTKGFIAVDGVSLTVVDRDDFSVTVSLVSYTLEHTILGKRRVGDIVNLETDIIGKYVESLEEQKKQTLNFEFLREYGFWEKINAR